MAPKSERSLCYEKGEDLPAAAVVCDGRCGAAGRRRDLLRRELSGLRQRGNEDTQTLIDILEKFHVKTTFFVVGDWVEKYPESVKALHSAGHEVMSHSNHHDHYNSLSTQQIIDDVTASNQRISASTGVTPTLIRCPYGEYDDHVIAAIRSMGMEPIQWDVERYHIAQTLAIQGLEEIKADWYY